MSTYPVPGGGRISAMVDYYMKTFDSNENGELTAPAEVGPNLGESRKHVTDRTTGSHIYSIGRLLSAADADGSGTVTKTELRNLIASYDTNGSKRLSLDEGGVFQAEVGERELRLIQTPGHRGYVAETPREYENTFKHRPRPQAR